MGRALLFDFLPSVPQGCGDSGFCVRRQLLQMCGGGEVLPPKGSRLFLCTSSASEGVSDMTSRSSILFPAAGQHLHLRLGHQPHSPPL